MSEIARGTWVEVPVERIAVRLHPERGPIELKVTFHDGTRRVVAVNPEADDPPVLEEILCGKARLVEETVPCWWG
jgi:hypothetical protein